MARRGELVGRHAEREHLERALDRARHGSGSLQRHLAVLRAAAP